jgi:hypothetical protein
VQPMTTRGVLTRTAALEPGRRLRIGHQRDCRQVLINRASAEAAGRSHVRLLAKETGCSGDCSGDVAALSAAQTTTNRHIWIGLRRRDEGPDVCGA